MTIFIGTDEAGYGPNLGPLLIAASAWQVPGCAREIDLYQALSRVIGRPGDDALLPIADSKLLYKPGGGLAALERGVYATLAQTRPLPRTWREVWDCLVPERPDGLDDVPWYAAFDAEVPTACPADEIEQCGRALSECLRAQHVKLLQLRATALFPGRFNDLVDLSGSKGTTLSEATLGLVRDLLDGCDSNHYVVQCDKHGGRNRYGPVLQQVFPDYLVEVVKESRAESIYRWGRRERRFEFRFVAKGEQFLPAALASMTAKYLRELAMLAFNAFWKQHLPELRPTAGYPTDAKRFRQQIEPLRNELGISDRVLWRRV